MTRFAIAALALAAMWFYSMNAASAQSLDDLKIQVHGYATQGFVYSTNNNWDTTNSTDGSAAWTEAVVNLTAQPVPKLSVGVQARYFLLGNYGNAITLDWAQADYKVNERFGFRVGKVKTPAGMLNEVQDIDPAYLWVLPPQSIYPMASRNSTLAHYGGVVYGALPLGESFGKLNYRAYGGQRVVSGDDGYLQPFRDEGLTLPNGLTGRLFGGTLAWSAPIQGLTAGASVDSEALSGGIAAGPYVGTFSTQRFYPVYFFTRYERRKAMFAGEYSRIAVRSVVKLPIAPPEYIATDQRSFYAMASYKLSQKLTAGMYYSSSIDLQVPVSSARFQKDWNLSARYDLSPFLYLKAEQHFIDGTELGYSTTDNANLKPNSRMTLLKLGVSF